MNHEFLLQALVYLGAAALFVPVFQRIGLGSVLGYLCAGVAIGPWGLGLITEMETVREVSELGVVLLLFLVGLELNPERLWSLRRSIFGMGTLQVVLTIVVVALATRATGLSWPVAVAVGAAASMSSTAIALQVLAERNLGNSPPGQAAFSVALFQDLAVVPLLLLVALLAPTGEHGGGFSWKAPAIAVALIATMVIAGRLLLRPLLRWIAGIGMREIFIAFALMLIVGSAWLTSSVGLSMALGAFIAGVLLADSEYRMELEVDIEPFKGLLLGLFFIAVGMAIDVGLILREPWLVLLLALGVVLLKIATLVGIAWTFKLCREDAWVFAMSLSQVGEFAFVMLGQAQADRLLTAEQAARFNAAVAVSMLTTPLLFLAWSRWVVPRMQRTGERPADTIDERNAVIVAGVGRFGQIVARMLHAKKVPTTLIDHDPNQIELLTRFRWRAYYGDARRPDVLESAGIHEARLLVLAMDDPKAVRETAEYVRRHHPDVKILARARGRTDAQDLERDGVPAIRETFDAALSAAEKALLALGHSPDAARRTVMQFREHDERMFRRQLEVEDEAQLIELAEQARRDFARLLETEARELAEDAGLDDTPAVPKSPATALADRGAPGV